MLLHDILDRQARRSPDRVAVRRGAVAWSYEVLRRRSVGYRDWLRDRDVGRGDRVLVAAPHAPETVAMLYAAARLGALYVIVGGRDGYVGRDGRAPEGEARVQRTGGP